MSRTVKGQLFNYSDHIAEAWPQNAVKEIARAEFAAGRPCSEHTAKRIKASGHVPLRRVGLKLVIHAVILRRLARLDRLALELGEGVDGEAMATIQARFSAPRARRPELAAAPVLSEGPRPTS